MPNADDTQLTKTVTVGQYKAMAAAGERAACGQFVVDRFHERYFEPTVNAHSRHGFTLMAIGCLVIEALECFYCGVPDSKGKSRLMFESFFKRRTGLEVFGGDADWFYYSIRCGILHQAEATGGWRIRRDCALLDKQQRLVNAKLFILKLQTAVADYSKQLESDHDLWANFKLKMDAVCKNCEIPP